MSHATDLIELPPRKGTLPWFDSMLFKPIRVKLALRLRPCTRPRCEVAHSPFGANRSARLRPARSISAQGFSQWRKSR
jgi:hypothetical protein